MEHSQADAIEPDTSKRILVVDDEKNIRFTVVHALRTSSFQVDAAASGVEGLDLFRRNSYDLLLIDLRMPGMTGLEMLREIRRTSPAFPPAVIVTAYGVPQQLLEAASLGAIDCIRKPFSIQVIRAMVREIFRRLKPDSDAAPQTADEFLNEGKRRLMVGNCDDAELALARAVALDPSLTDGHFHLGICALLGGRNDEAADHFRRVLMFDSTNKTAGEYLAWLSEKDI